MVTIVPWQEKTGMKDLIEFIGPFFLIALPIFMYVFIMQATNDSTCDLLNMPDSPIFGGGFVKFIALCWW